MRRDQDLPTIFRDRDVTKIGLETVMTRPSLQKPNFTKFSLHVKCGGGSVLLCSYGFVGDVMCISK